MATDCWTLLQLPFGSTHCYRMSHMMFPVFVLLTIVVVATPTAADHPHRHFRSRDFLRNIRSRDSHPLSELHDQLSVSVSPKTADIYYGETVTIQCNVKAGYGLQDYPFVNFYKQIEFPENGQEMTVVLPITSNYPGTTIQEVDPVAVRSQYNRSIKLLTLDTDAYTTLLDYGDNVFYCQGSTDNGDRELAYFIVRKY